MQRVPLEKKELGKCLAKGAWSSRSTVGDGSGSSSRPRYSSWYIYARRDEWLAALEVLGKHGVLLNRTK